MNDDNDAGWLETHPGKALAESEARGRLARDNDYKIDPKKLQEIKERIGLSDAEKVAVTTYVRDWNDHPRKLSQVIVALAGGHMNFPSPLDFINPFKLRSREKRDKEWQRANSYLDESQVTGFLKVLRKYAEEEGRNPHSVDEEYMLRSYEHAWQAHHAAGGKHTR